LPLPEFESLHPALKEVRTRPLFVMQLGVRPMQQLGATPGGTRRVAAVSGGTFRGERLRGEVLEGGSDWQVVRSDAVTLDVRLVLKTDDGAMIGMRYPGLRHGPPEVMSRLDRGEPVSPGDYYFRSQPVFETSAPRYEWLNRVLAIGVGHRLPDGPVYSIFEIL
jgi:hypothetical protein